MKRISVHRSTREAWLRDLVDSMVRCGASGIRIEVSVQEDGKLVTVGVCSSAGKMNDEQVALRAIAVLAETFGITSEQDEVPRG